MTPEEFSRKVKAHEAELQRYIQRQLPVKIGAKAKSIFQENFRKGGFQDGASFEAWPATKRQISGRGADAGRGPLLSSRKVLYSSIRYVPGNGHVVISSDVAYAGIHNDGGTTHPRVTPKMRKYAWARYYEAGGSKAASKEADQWKGLALTKKQTLNIKIPRRHFIGPTTTLTTAVQTMVEKDLINILSK